MGFHLLSCIDGPVHLYSLCMISLRCLLSSLGLMSGLLNFISYHLIFNDAFTSLLSVKVSMPLKLLAS